MENQPYERPSVPDFIEITRSAFSPDECQAIIDFYEKYAAAGFTLTRQQLGENKFRKMDTSLCSTSVPWLRMEHSQEIWPMVNERLWAQLDRYMYKYNLITEIPLVCNYMKIQKTDLTEGYHIWHAENLGPQLDHRIGTFIVYLNDVLEGGETEFLYYGKRVKPETGMMVTWPASFTHVHRGNPPLSNAKYVLTGWLEFA